MGIRVASCGKAGNFARCIIVLCSLLAFNAPADLIVDLGSAKDFMFLDIGSDPSRNALLAKGRFGGDIGWSGGTGTKIKLRKGVLSGDIYRAADSTLKIKKGGEHLGTDHPAADMSRFIADVDAAVARFGTLNQDMDLGSIHQSGGLTIDRTDEYTVVDVDSFSLFNGTLTLNGQVDDVFYIRISNAFDLFNVDVNVVGTDPSRVFFIYGGTNDLTYGKGSFLGNIIAPNAAVLLSDIEGFSGSVISGDGFSVTGKYKDTAFDHTVAIPEPAVLSMVGLFAGGVLFLRRIFWNKVVKSNA